MSAAEAERLLGTADLRHIVFDCRQSLVLANDGAPGWLIVPQADHWWFDGLFSSGGEGLQLVYRHDAALGTPSFDVYYWPGTGSLSLAEGWVKSAMTGEGAAIDLPTAVNETAQLAAYQVVGDQWLTLWSVLSPTSDPLSIQAHLYAALDAPPQVGDALGYSSDQWQTGDWLVQRHEFPGQEHALLLKTALYNYQTLELLSDTLSLPAR